MGSMGGQSFDTGFYPVRVELPANGAYHGIDSVALVEACWAITDWIYNDYDSTKVVKHIIEASTTRRTITNILSTAAAYHIVRGETILEIMRTKQNIRQTTTDLHSEGCTIFHDSKVNTSATLLITHHKEIQSMLKHDVTENDANSTVLSLNVHRGSANGGLYFSNHAMIGELAPYMVDTFTQMITSLYTDTQLPIGQLRLMSQQKLSSVLQLGGNPVPVADEWLGDMAIHQKGIRPEAVAIDAWDGRFTYHELHEESRKLATSLLASGLGVGDRVPYCLKKSKWTMVVILAITMAGGTCVPLDIRAPVSRIKLVLEEIDARHVVCDQSTVCKFDGLDVQVIDPVDPILNARGGHIVWPSIGASAAAFIFFTSGSTGTPKGVVWEHGAVYATLRNLSTVYALTSKSRLLQYASYVFDVSIGDMFTPMLQGACVCVPSEEQRMDDLAGAISDLDVTHACLTNTVISRLDPTRVPSLQHLFVGGEAFERAQLARWQSSVQLRVVYGTTESIIWDSVADCSTLQRQHQNIGYSFGPRMWIVDPHNPDQLKPPGAVGEILLEGPILARGYLKREATNSPRFRPAPEWLHELRKNTDIRCYRTGDIGYRNPDGSIVVLGRADTQVKINGQRVELGEIEHFIRHSMPMSDQIVVDALSLPKDGSSKTLVVFFVPTEDMGTDEDTVLTMNEKVKHTLKCLQQTLAHSLPPHMIPALYVPVRQLPRTSAGKLDRKILRQWAASLDSVTMVQYFLRQTNSEKQFRTADEVLLRELWSTVLRIPAESISVTDHFFEVGGDSIKAIELVEQLRERGKSLRVSQIIQHTQLEGMAALLGDTDLRSLGGPTIGQFDLVKGAITMKDCLNHVSNLCQVADDMIEDIYPATPMQEALMAISARRPGLYTCQAVFRLSEAVDPERLTSAWRTLVMAQSILRTRIVLVPHMGTVQVVIRPDFEDNGVTSLSQYLQTDLARSMTFGTELCHGRVVLDEQKPYFVWSAHHAVYDSWSQMEIFREFRHAYLTGIASEQIPYNRFINHVTEIDGSKDAAFWSKHFQHERTKFPHIVADSYTPEARQTRSITLSHTRGQTMQYTTANIIQATWALITARRTGTADALFGLTLSGRDAQVLEISKMTGPTMVTIPIVINIHNSESISQFLNSVRAQIARVGTHQFTGLQHIRQLVPAGRAATDLQNILVIDTSESGPYDELSKLGLELTQLHETDCVDRALTVRCSVKTGKINVEAIYDENIFSGELVQSLLHQFEFVFEQLATESTQKTVFDVDMVSPHDLRQMAAWTSKEPSAVEATIHSLVEASTTTKPNDLAVTSSQGDYSYYELNSLADRLANYLFSALGVGPEIYVVLCFRKSVWPAVAMLAVLKCGGVCVSVNPDHPSSRLLEIYRDVGASVVLCDPESVPRFQSEVTYTMAINQAAISSIAVSEWQKPVVLPGNAAFVVYTSGSTGKPKGSILEHRALATSLNAIGDNTRMGSNIRTLQFSAYTFDAHILEIFGTWIHGGCLCVISDSERMNCLEKTIHDLGVNWALLTPTVARMLHPSRIPSLQTLILSGEALAQQDLTLWADQLFLCNGLGPSECSILACVTARVKAGDNPSNIGHAIGCRLWITEHRRPNRLAPVGCTGELVIEGPIVGRGYVNRPKATAAAFVTDLEWSRPSPNQESQRSFYRTGDLAKFNTDGSVTFLGRADTQVKIRGQRVELGEIENSLRRFCGTDKVVVEVLTGQRRGNVQTLAAFVVFPIEHDDNDVDATVLSMNSNYSNTFSQAQAKMATLLPRFMVPTMFVPIRRLPVSASGKLERKTLQDWVTRLSSEELPQYYLVEGGSHEPLATDNERQLCKLWVQVLGVPENSVGAGENFFQSGGDSVTAMELIAMARESGFSLTVAHVFESPKLCDMARVLQKAPDGVASDQTVDRFALIDERVDDLDSFIDGVARECRVDRAKIEDLYPCTPIQEVLMAVTAHRPNAYTHRAVFKLPASLDVERFKSAWETVVEAHAIFRTRFLVRPGLGALQVVLRPGLKWIAATSLEDYIRDDRATPIQYGGTMCRWGIVNDHDGATFVWTVHHALYDGWSLPRVFNEVRQTYEGKSLQGVVPFNRFVRHLDEINRADADAFWRNQFPDVYESYPRLPRADYNAQPRQRKTLVADISRSRPSRSKVTTATVVQAAWALVMARHAGSDHALFGLTLSGRDSAVSGVTAMLAPTLTTIPMRIPIRREKSLIDYLLAVQEQVACVRKYQHSGLQHIRRLSAEAKAAVDFQHVLVIQTEDAIQMISPFKDLGLQVIDQNEDDFLDLALTTEIVIRPDGIHVSVQYDENVIAKDQMQCILHQFEHILGQLATESAHLTVDNLDMISPHDLRQLELWYPLKDLPTTDVTIHSLVEKHALLSPEAQATSGFDVSYTYKQLNDTANKLASYLTELGVGPEVRVLLCFGKSTWPIIAILGILKSGGVCVSIDPEHPPSRLLEICRDVEADIMLCDADKANRVDVKHTIAVDSALLSTIPDSNWEGPQVSPDNAAFIIFTSGSTGKPKGTVLEHRSLCTSLAVNAAMVGLDATTRTMQFAAYTFDIHILEIFGTLTQGGCICVISDSERKNDIAKAIQEHQVNQTMLTSTIAKLLSPEMVPTLRSMMLIGEPVKRQNLQTWANSIRLYNSYGPSETCIGASISRQLQVDSDPSNIGYGLACRLWITEYQQPDRLAPIGCVGELIIEGPIVGRGYVNRPQATAAAFLTDLKWARNDLGQTRRFYRTGDLARFNIDGSIVCLGRADTQVKIRGQRVELGEIENLLKQSCKVFTEQVAVDVFAIAGQENLQMLTAFIVLSDTDHADGPILTMKPDTMTKFQEVQEQLTEVLPKHMVPSVFLPIKALPVSTSGKLERKTLREWFSRLGTNDLMQYQLVYRAPVEELTTDAEYLLHKFWVQVLRAPEDSTIIGAGGNFFHLGGDSVTAMELVAALRAAELSLTVAEIFRAPRLRDMAQLLQRSEQNTNQEVEPFSLTRDKVDHLDRYIDEVAQDCQVSRDIIEDIYPCTPTQEALIAVTAYLPNAYVNRNFFRLPRSFDIARFKAAWEMVVDAHAILRTRIITTNGLSALQVVLRSKLEWTSTTATSLSDYLDEDRKRQIHYGDPISRWCIFSTGQDHIFAWTMHHALYDGWSFSRLLDEVKRVYNGGQLREAIPFNRFIQHLDSIDVSASETFWNDQFRDMPAIFPFLPTVDYVVRPSRRTKLDMHLRRLANSDITTATIVQAAWVVLMARYANSRQALFGLTLSGRDTAVSGIANILAPTLNTVPFKMAIEQSDIAGFLEAVQEQITQVKVHQHMGLQAIRKLSAEADVAVKFQNILVVQAASALEASAVPSFESMDIQPVEQFNDDFYNIALTTEVVMCPEDRLSISMQYDDKVIPSERMECILHQFEHVLTQLATESQESILDINMVSPYDLQQMATWSSTEPEAVENTLHSLVAAQAVARPNAIAISTTDGDYTYSYLEQTAGKLAGYLATLGAGPEVRVILCFDKGFWPIITMLAVLKCGGACVSVNPEHPTSRLVEICQDVAVTVLLCDADKVERFKPHVPCVVSVDETLLSTLSTSSYLNPRVQPTNTAFILYTSGSTGTPKGSIHAHRSLCTSLLNIGARTNMTSTTRTLQFSAYTFDVHFLEIFGTWVQGGCVCVISEFERMNTLEQTINKLRVNWTSLTPTVARMLEPAHVPCIETIALGGEPLTRGDLETWAASVNLIGTYGPSECCVVAVITKRLTASSNPKNIGFASGCRLWVTECDRVERLAPLGCVGELCIQGPIVSKGYLNRPEVSARSFVEGLPWCETMSQHPGIVYRSGDLAICNTDGSITIVGRADTQVKIHGQRVELGDIEHHVYNALANLATEHSKKCAQIAEARVVVEVVTEDKDHSMSVVAFVCAKSSQPSESVDALLKELTPELRQRLSQKLPRYMVPAVFAGIPTVPLSPTGKINRKLLREMGKPLVRPRLGTDATIVRPSQVNWTTAEKSLCKLWATTLGIDDESIDLSNDFFDLNGDSVVAMRLVGAARKSGLSLTVSNVFKHPRLADMAAISTLDVSDLSTQAKVMSLSPGEMTKLITKRIASLLPYPKADVINILPLSYFQSVAVERNLQTPPQHMYYWLLDLPSSVEDDRVRSICHQLVDHFEMLRTIFVRDSGRLWQMTLKTLTSSFSCRHSPDNIEIQTDKICRQDSLKPLTAGSSFTQFWLLRGASAKVRLIIRLSHAQYDGISLTYLMRAFATLCDGQSVQNYQSLSSYMNHLAKRNKDSYHHWRSLLSGSSMTVIEPRLPLERVEESRAIRFTKCIPNWTERRDVTPATIFTAACALTMLDSSKADEIVFGRLVSGRASLPVDAQEIFGPCMNIIPVRVRQPNDQDTDEVVKSVRKQYIDSIEHETVGLDEIVENCTDWPKSTTHWRIVSQYQNIEQAPAMDTSQFSSKLHYWHDESAQPWIESIYMLGLPQEDGIEVFVGASSRYYRADTIQTIHQRLCAYLEKLGRRV